MVWNSYKDKTLKSLKISRGQIYFSKFEGLIGIAMIAKIVLYDMRLQQCNTLETNRMAATNYQMVPNWPD